MSKEKKVPWYTNSSQLPVGYSDDLFECLELQENLQTKYTGGTVFHTFLGEKITAEQAKKLIKTAFKKSKMPYLSISPTFSVCQEHGYLKGEQPKCPECGKECEVWARVVGYLRPVSGFNVAKVSEYKKRKVFKI